ncbi:unnamed protein product [Urochloa decumbens]|uniref:Activator of Hsp90 ATPase AHSA1-like N-terminal domain-containing protein n=1 Tax=Urochloa decumbens TaxID=240449 RepID=A0ABC9E3C3_9POAL
MTRSKGARVARRRGSDANSPEEAAARPNPQPRPNCPTENSPPPRAPRLRARDGGDGGSGGGGGACGGEGDVVQVLGAGGDGRRRAAACAPQARRRRCRSDAANPAPATLGCAWNQAGTWEEKNLNSWANSRIKDLLGSLDPLEFSTGKASVYEVSRCSGDAFLVIVRNKKRVGYTYELSLKFKGEWLIKEANKKVKGHLEIPEFSYGELEDLEVNVRFSDEKDLSSNDKAQICKDLKSFLSPIQEKLREFEKEMKER